jgi:glycosyltransferase involved in cell wall biosynthesis
MLRILIVNPNRSLVGGTETYLRNLLPALQRQGHSLALLHEFEAPDGAAVIDDACSPLPRWSVIERGPSSCLREINKWCPDVVYLHGLVDGSLEEELTYRYPCILYAHNYYGTCSTGTKCHFYPTIRPCSRKFSVWCLLLNYTHRCGGLNPIRLWGLHSAQARRHRLLTRYRAVLVASRHMESEYRRHGMLSDRLFRLPLPLPGTHQLVELPEWSGWTNRVLLVGRLTRLKGGELLIPAMVKAGLELGRRLTLVIAGTGPEQSSWQHLADCEGLDCEFIGWVDETRLQELRQQIDLVAVPSVWPEPFGLVGIEGGSAGAPAVGFASGGISDWLIPGTSGESSPADPPTISGLASAIVRALRDPQHYQSLRVGAWEVAQTFRFDHHLEQLELILNMATKV